MRPIITAALALAVIAGASGEAAAKSRTPVGGASGLVARAENAVGAFRLRATLYHAGGGGATGKDSLGCQPVAMRTVATDPKVIPRRTKLFIAETVGMRMPNGERHDGIWYASDTGGAVKGSKIDLYTGHGRASMQPAMMHNTRHLTVTRAGTFRGCPPLRGTQIARNTTGRG